MDLSYPEECLLCLGHIVPKPKVNTGKDELEAKVENFEQLCKFLKVEFPVSRLQFQRILAEKNKKCCELLLCSKCLGMLKDISSMYTELRRVESKIDFGIRAVQQVVRKSDEEGTEEVGSPIHDEATSNEQESFIEAGGGSDSSQCDQQHREEGSVVKRRKVELCEGEATSSTVADYREFVKTFRDLVKQVVTKEPESWVPSGESISEISQQLDEDVDLEADVSPPASPASSSNLVIVEQDIEQDSTSASEDIPAEIVSRPSSTRSVGTNTARDNPQLAVNSEPSTASTPFRTAVVPITSVSSTVSHASSTKLFSVSTCGIKNDKATSTAIKPKVSFSFTCRYCSIIFSSPVLYYIHRKKEHPLESEHLNIPSLKRTRDGSTTPILFRLCPICGEQKNPKGSIFRHFIEHMLSHEILSDPSNSYGQVNLPAEHDRPNICDQCGQRFVLEMNLDLHKICYHESSLSQLKCDKCGDASNKTGEDLASHLVKDHGMDTIYSCKSCPMACTTADNLLEHMHIHAMSKRLPCSECNHVVLSMKALYQHFHDCHPNMLTTLKCDPCRKVFLMPATFRRHMEAGHTTETTISPVTSSPPEQPPHKIQCPHCLEKRLFKNKITLDNHIRIQHDPTANKHKCDYCSKEFIYRSALLYHTQQVHLGIRYPCPYCLKSFTSKSLLNGHLKLHASSEGHNAVIPCNICGKSLSSRNTLRVHMTTQHEPRKPVTCQICNRLFANVYSLRAHKNEMHAIKPFSCPQCPQKFGRAKQFNYHLTLHGIHVQNINTLISKQAN